MALRGLDKTDPIEAVLFDFHSTLIDQGDPRQWLRLAWAQTGRPGDPAARLGSRRFEQLAHWIDHIWEHVVEVDPNQDRDRSPVRHREVFDVLMARIPEMDPELSLAMYEVLLDPWFPYQDSVPTLRELKRRGIKLALVSNVGIDIRQVIDRSGMGEYFDALVLSYEAGSVKPESSIFQQALDALGAAPEHALMVGDNPHDDAGAALLGIRTLILPRTRGRDHGLDLVLKIVRD